MMEKAETENTAQQPSTERSPSQSSEEEYEEETEDEDDEGFVGVSGGQSDKGQSEADGVDEEEDEDDEQEEEEGAAVQPKSNYFARILSIWNTTKYISKWKMAHRRGYHIDCLTSDSARKALLMQQELDFKTSIPLPMVCMIEREALQILENIEKDYKRKVGASHHLTHEVQERIERLRSQVSAKVGDCQSAPEGGVLGSLWRWGSALSAMLTGSAGASADVENILPRKESHWNR